MEVVKGRILASAKQTIMNFAESEQANDEKIALKAKIEVLKEIGLSNDNLGSMTETMMRGARDDIRKGITKARRILEV